MSNYTTQMDAARKGIVTPEIEKVAKKEKMDVDKLMELVASGKVAIPAYKSIPATILISASALQISVIVCPILPLQPFIITFVILSYPFSLY